MLLTQHFVAVWSALLVFAFISALPRGIALLALSTQAPTGIREMLEEEAAFGDHPSTNGYKGDVGRRSGVWRYHGGMQGGRSSLDGFVPRRTFSQVDDHSRLRMLLQWVVYGLFCFCVRYIPGDRSSEHGSESIHCYPRRM